MLLVLGAPLAPARADAFAPGFTTKTVTVAGTTWHYRIGGAGPTVVLLHGYGDTGDMWAPLAPLLAKDYQVIVPDLPGLGESRPEPSTQVYEMVTVARELHALLLSLNVARESVVGHDIGLMVAYAYAAQYRPDVTRLALIDAPIPGVGPWQDVLLMPAIWHFHFNGPYAEQLTAGREQIYMNRLWDAFAFHPERVGEAERTRTAASYAQAGNMHAGFSYFEAFYRDADANAAFAKTPLTIPVLALGGSKSFAELMPKFARAVATNVESGVIPDSGHWVMSENPDATDALLLRFLSAP